ncbi:hypothetical protein DPMN_135378 [Dreissena polymorpha]|uniref:Uncharacterized protein n=1 Tax=Dreissena polymorpha TaxID=45954 RepID=A0A9D4G1S3_DREPO|nr:hypothetical protein DPMN_135378 [Dreissena polymorpha]
MTIVIPVFSSCNEAVQSSSGCTPVSGPQPPTDVTIDIDTDRQMEKIHAIFFSNMEKMEAMQGMGNVPKVGINLGLQGSLGN